MKGLLWAAAVSVSERAARRLLPSRAAALLVVYGGLLAAAPRELRAPAQGPSGRVPPVAAALVLAGYPLGRELAGDVPSDPPPDGLAEELVALGVVVPLAEELLWGNAVERELGVAVTSLLFALKHCLVDGRWRRAPGLAAFWAGLGLTRRRSRTAARALHVCANSAAVLVGHAGGRDQF